MRVSGLMLVTLKVPFGVSKLTWPSETLQWKLLYEGSPHFGPVLRG